MRDYDLIVIGSGPAGHHAAIQGAKLGRRVGIVERQPVLGGVCMNTGTIPSKTLREAVLYLSGVHQRGFYGVSYRVKPQVTMQDLMFRCHHVIQREVDVYRAQFARNGVDLLEGEAAFQDPHTILVTTTGSRHLYRAERFVIATGTAPVRPRGMPTDHGAVIDSDGLSQLGEVPRSMIVVGGGVIGMEYACMFSTLGVSVTLVDGRHRLLEFLDGEIVDALVYHMRSARVTFRLGEVVEGVELIEGRRVVAHLASQKQLHADTLLSAAGRQGNTEHLNLGAAGLRPDNRGRLAVDREFRTAVPHIYAAGDVVGFPSLASVSMEQARVSVCHAFGFTYKRQVAELYPYGVYTIPEVSCVGLAEDEAARRGI